MRSETAQWPAAVLLAAGLTALFASCFELPVSLWIPVSAAAAAALTASLFGKGKYAAAVSAGWALLAAGMLFLSRAGLGTLLNGFFSAWQRIFPRIYPTYAEGTEAAATAAAALAILPGLFSAAYVRRPRRLFFWAAALSAAALTLFFAKTASLSQLALAALLLLLLYAVRFGGGGCAGTVRAWCRPAVLFLLAAGLLQMGVGTAAPEALQRVRQSLSDTVRQQRYGTNQNAGLTDGDLTLAGTRRRTTDAMLTVTMTEPSSYYLRGFVGEDYTGSRWEAQSSETLAESADTFYWLHRDGFYGNAQVAAAAACTVPELTEKENRVTVTNAGASSRYLYTPYETLPDSESLAAEAVGDAAQVASGLRGQREYCFTASGALLAQYQKIAAGLAAKGEAAVSFLEEESAYNRYVYAADTEIPAEIESYLAKKLGTYSVEEGQRHFDYQKAKQNILFYLTTYAAYREEVAAVPEGVDFVLNFLDGTQSGYDVHYASAAVMMFRYYGIPARYAEGFLVTKAEAEKLQSGETLTLDGTHGHAWAEYYQDGVGWLPFEVTPGYLSVMEQTETYRNISGLVGHTSQEKLAENLESQEQDDSNPSLLSLWLRHRMRFFFLLSVAAVCVMLLLFLVWLICQRRKTARRKAGFLGEDIPRAIRSIYRYLTDLLLAEGLTPRNCPAADYAERVDADLREEYLAVTALWEEAKFSIHPMEEGQRTRALQLTEEVWRRLWRKAGPLERIRLKYVLFL